MPTDGVEGFNVDEDQRHVRRSLTDDELARLIAHAETGRPILGMPGPLRAMAYRVAAVTGFRVDELRSLTPESFRLDGPRPCITLAARDAKNRRPVDQPIPMSIVAPLRDWLRDKARWRVGVSAPSRHRQGDPERPGSDAGSLTRPKMAWPTSIA